MNRTLQRATLVVALSGAQSAWGLGLGDAAVTSDMSSPLRMTAPLVGVDPSLDLESLRVDVPGEIEHEQLGFADPIRPRDLRVRLSTAGAPRIEVRTRSVLREPVLRFLLRVTWPGGQALREYELIIDPPAVARPVGAGGTATVVRPVASPQPLAAPAPAPTAAPRAGDRYGPVVAGDTLLAIARAAYPQQPEIATAMQVLVDRNPGAFVAGDASRLVQGAFLELPPVSQVDAARTSPVTAAPRAGTLPAAASGTWTVAAGDTLYSIARRVAPQAATGDVVRRIYESNPQAFADGDMDRLQAGAVLRLPGAAPAAVSSAPASTLPAQPSEQAPEQAPEQATEQAPAAAAPEQVAALRSEIEAAESVRDEARARQGALRERLDNLLATVESLRARDAALTAEAESLGNELERRTAAIAAARDAAVAGLAGAASPATADATPATPDTSSAITDAAPATPETSPVIADATPAMPERAPSTADATPVTPETSPVTADATPAVPETTPATADATPVTTETPPAAADTAPGAASPVAAPAPRRVSRPAPEPGLLDRFLPLAMNPLVWIVAAALLLAVLAIAALRILNGRSRAPEPPRQRADEEATAQKLAEVRERHTESGRFEAEQLAAAEAEKAKKAKESPVHLTDTARAGTLAKEAAVHLAYEDYSAAKACITEAIRLDPHRDEHKMVLVTVYEATGEHATARAIVNDLLSRREQLPRELRQQVEQLHQKAAG